MPDTKYCLKPSVDTTFAYTGGNQSFTVTATKSDISWQINENGELTEIAPLTAIAAITGTTTVGSVLTAGALTPSGATASYQWQSSTTSNGTYTNISGATSSTYTLVSSDLNKYLKVVATGTGTYNSTQTSAASAQIAPISLTSIAAITGTTTVGSVLTAGALAPSGATASYQWQSATTAGGTYTNISGATGSTYMLVSGDGGKYLKVVATGTGNYSGSQISAASSHRLSQFH
ncbi:MAG: hypothetical protein PHY48_16250 [Candidatus Cloacimonetes bacterium]|nr:hypothetical protein [Candidatus Cloacimonadota bacterium]